MDTSVLVAGIAGFRPGGLASGNASAAMLRAWLERGVFVWVVSEEILDEYKTVLRRLGVRRATVGLVVNLVREEAELVSPRRRQISPDPGDDPFCVCAEDGRADFVVTLNPRDFPQEALQARVVRPGEMRW